MAAFWDMELFTVVEVDHVSAVFTGSIIRAVSRKNLIT
jgi:hypothetical protein